MNSSPLYRKAAPKPQEDTQSDVLRSKVARLVGEVRSLPEQQAAIVLGMRDALAALKKVPAEYYTRAFFQQREREIKAQAKLALDRAEEAAAERVEQMRALCEAATKRNPGSVAEQQLLEAKLANAWTNLRQVLDTAAADREPLKALEAVSERIIGDNVSVEALRRFGPNYVESHFTDQTKQVRERIQAALNAAADRAEAPTLTPAQLAGRELLADVERGMGRLQLDSGIARREIEGYAGETAGALASWDGEAIYLTDRGQPLPSEVVRVAFGPEARAWEIAAAKNYPLLTERGAVADTMPALPGQPKTAADMIRYTGGTVAPAGSEPPAY